MVRRGICMLDGSHPITNADELRRTIRLASERGASRDSLRWHCIKRATGMGLLSAIPADWRGDGKTELTDKGESLWPFPPNRKNGSNPWRSGRAPVPPPRKRARPSRAWTQRPTTVECPNNVRGLCVFSRRALRTAASSGNVQAREEAMASAVALAVANTEGGHRMRRSNVGEANTEGDSTAAAALRPAARADAPVRPARAACCRCRCGCAGRGEDAVAAGGPLTMQPGR